MYKQALEIIWNFKKWSILSYNTWVDLMKVNLFLTMVICLVIENYCSQNSSEILTAFKGPILHLCLCRLCLVITTFDLNASSLRLDFHASNMEKWPLHLWLFFDFSLRHSVFKLKCLWDSWLHAAFHFIWWFRQIPENQGCLVALEFSQISGANPNFSRAFWRDDQNCPSWSYPI